MAALAAVTAAVGSIIPHLHSPATGCTGTLGGSCLPLAVMDVRAVALSAMANEAEEEKLSCRESQSACRRVDPTELKQDWERHLVWSALRGLVAIFCALGAFFALLGLCHQSATLRHLGAGWLAAVPRA